MSRVTAVRSLTDENLELLRTSRKDILLEIQDGTDCWRCLKGPFSRYERRLAVDHVSKTITEVTEYDLAIRFWKPYLFWGFKRVLQRRERPGRTRWWWPNQVVDSQTSESVSILAAISAASGFMGVLLSQNIAYIGREFGASLSEQSTALAMVRGGILASLLVVPRADKLGRKPVLLAASALAVALTVATAAAPSLTWVVAFQTLARACITAMFSLCVLASIEEVPATWRASAVTVVGLAGGLGGALTTVTLPIVDQSNNLWRVGYLATALFGVVIYVALQHLSETRRFSGVDSLEIARTSFTKNDLRRLSLVCVVFFCVTFFFTPASSLRITFLDDIGYSATEITVFLTVVSIPSTLAVVAAGVWSDRWGRKPIGAIALGVSLIVTTISYQLPSPWLLIGAAPGMITMSMAFPAIYGYKNEIFPTKVRAKASAWADAAIVAGSGCGLAVSSLTISNLGSLPAAIALIAPLTVVGIIVFVATLPETARTPLEDLEEPP